MRAVGLVAEYNPFHNGHLHHLHESLREAEADVSVAVMSGHFLQRGEPALVDKWTRTEMALAAGVDVVVELPFFWACNSAPHFADGAIQSLAALGVQQFCFGSEAGELESLKRCAALLETHVVTIQERTAGLLREGVNYPLARARVVAELVGEAALTEVMHAPNNILGIEYLRVAQRLDGMEGRTIQRIGAGYHDAEAVGMIASATGIRRMLSAREDVRGLLPDESAKFLSSAVDLGRAHDPAATFRLLAARLLDDRVALRELYLVADGIDRRLVEAAATCRDLEGLVDTIKSRQLTRTRVQRMLMHVLVGSHADEVARSLVAGPRYLHLLGASAKGREFLNRSRKLRELPLVSNYSRIQNVLKRCYGVDSNDYQIALEQLRVEERCSAIYTLLMRHWSAADRRRDYFEPVRGFPA